MGRKVKIINDTSLIPVNVSSSSIVNAKSQDITRDSFLAAKLDKEIERSTKTDESLQEQIDVLREKGFAVVDVVNTYDDLMHYDTTFLINKDIIIVLYDENGREEGDRSSYYRWDGHSFTCIGSSTYTIDEIDKVINDLKEQIAHLDQKGTIKDVVSTHADLNNYDITNLVPKDIIVILDDELLNHATTYYILTEDKQWEVHGSMGPNYYNKREIDAKLAEINEHLVQVDTTLENHELRITDNRTELDDRISEQDALDILRGE